jgi:hypothetical protein
MVCLFKRKLPVPVLSVKLTFYPVAFASSWIIPGGVSRFLLGRHVLLLDIFHSCKFATQLSIRSSSLQNIELFFCLYANYWNNPSQCNSTSSRLLGFFTAMPAVWRALQCLRRFYDTRNVFPHLVNCGKYGMTILYYVTLSMYRIDQTNGNLALFCTFATISSIYACKSGYMHV